MIKNKQWALNWIAKLAQIEKYHTTEEGATRDGTWIEKNEAITMLLEAENIMKIELDIN